MLLHCLCIITTTIFFIAKSVHIIIMKWYCFIAIDYISDKKEKLDNSTKLLNVILNLFEIPEKLEKESFNSALEYETGTKTGISVSSLLDDIITNNKKNENNKIVVVFLDFNSSKIIDSLFLKEVVFVFETFKELSKA